MPATIVADRLNRDPAELALFDARIAAAGLRPSRPSERAALLLLTTLAGASVDTVVPTARAILELADCDGSAVGLVAALIDALGDTTGRNDLASLAYRSTISVVLGDGPAVVVRIGGDDEPEEWAFTDDGGPFAPHRDTAVSVALACPGRILFRVARDLADREPPTIDRRTFRFETVQ